MYEITSPAAKNPLPCTVSSVACLGGLGLELGLGLGLGLGSGGFRVGLGLGLGLGIGFGWRRVPCRPTRWAHLRERG